MDPIKNVCCQATVEEYENKIAQSSEALEKCKQFAERQMEDIKVEMIEMTKKLLEQNAVIKKILGKNKRLKEFIFNLLMIIPTLQKNKITEIIYLTQVC